MEFEIIDKVQGDTLEVGDIICLEGEYHNLRNVSWEDDEGVVVINSYNLSTGDELVLSIDPDISYVLYRSY